MYTVLLLFLIKNKRKLTGVIMYPFENEIFMFAYIYNNESYFGILINNYIN